MTVTSMQQEVYQMHKDICVALGIPQCSFVHRKLAGTIGASTGAGNTIYGAPATQQDYSAEEAGAPIPVWLVFQSFIRGEERGDEYAPAIIATPLQEAQCPAIDDNGNLVPVTENDIFIDTQAYSWRVMNPVLDPASSFWSMLMEKML
jgi:hypothetical protein